MGHEFSTPLYISTDYYQALIGGGLAPERWLLGWEAQVEWKEGRQELG
jgi:hypothetical protein